MINSINWFAVIHILLLNLNNLMKFLHWPLLVNLLLSLIHRLPRVPLHYSLFHNPLMYSATPVLTILTMILWPHQMLIAIPITNKVKGIMKHMKICYVKQRIGYGNVMMKNRQVSLFPGLTRDIVVVS